MQKRLIPLRRSINSTNPLLPIIILKEAVIAGAYCVIRDKDDPVIFRLTGGNVSKGHSSDNEIDAPDCITGITDIEALATFIVTAGNVSKLHSSAREAA